MGSLPTITDKRTSEHLGDYRDEDSDVTASPGGSVLAYVGRNDTPPQTQPEDLRVEGGRREEEMSRQKHVPSQGFVGVTPNSIRVKQTLAKHCQRVVSERHESRETKGKVAKRLKDKLMDIKQKLGESEQESVKLIVSSSCNINN